MAECLVHERVPWAVFDKVVVKDETVAQAVRVLVGAASQDTAVTVRGDWYF